MRPLYSRPSMLARILSTILFWILMTFLILGAIPVVFGLYLPFVALKALYLAVTGQLSKHTGTPRRGAAWAPPAPGGAGGTQHFGPG